MIRLTILAILLTFEIFGCQGAYQKVSTVTWTSPIQYMFDTSSALSSATETTITTVLNNQIHAFVPGLSFTEVSTAPTLASYILFTLDTTRTTFCEDQNLVVGAQAVGTATTVSITESLNCNTQGWIIHLVMHALGFYHEHQRPDRSNYTYVKTDNSFLPTTAKSALFDIQPGGVVSLSASYDFASATHYDYQAAASSGKETIVAMPPEYYSLKSYGHATSATYTANSVLSIGDMAALQAMFPSSTSITVVTNVCYNGGTWYNWCICKPGYAGQYCSETYCYNNCVNSGYCAINSTTNLPQCVCPTGYSGTYCEIAGTSANCSSSGTCPWWSTCNSGSSTCDCDPYPYYGPTCSIAITTVPTTSTVSTSTSTASSTATESTTSSTATATATTTAQVACTASNVGAPRSVTYAANAVYLRMALYDIPYMSDYSNLGSTSSVALQNFLAEALQGDYQTQTSGQFISVLIQNIQPPVSGTTSGCTVVDFLAKFTSNLTPLQRTKVVQASYAKATSTNLPSLFGTLGTNTNKATIVSSVLYITPLNSAISPASPCAVYSSEGACLNGGSCTGSGANPVCVCTTSYSGTYCEIGSTSTFILQWPIWQIVVVSIAAAVAVLLFILLISYFVRQAQNKNWYHYMWNGGPDRYYDYDMRARQMQMAPTYMVPAEPSPIHPAYYAQNAGYGPASNTALPPPYGAPAAAAGYQRPKHYQYPFNIQ